MAAIDTAPDLSAFLRRDQRGAASLAPFTRARLRGGGQPRPITQVPPAAPLYPDAASRALCLRPSHVCTTTTTIRNAPLTTCWYAESSEPI